MKTYKLGVSLLVVAGGLLLGACSDSATNETTTTDSVNSTMDSDSSAMQSGRMNDMSTSAATDSNKTNQDAINYLVPKNASEIAWLMAGKTKGTSKELKNHADMMLRDHKKLEATVKGYLAKHTSITAPPADTTGAVNLIQPKGAEWDKAWTQKMITDHNEIMAKLIETENTASHTDLKKIATDTKAVVQSHLDMVNAMDAKMK